MAHIATSSYAAGFILKVIASSTRGKSQHLPSPTLDLDLEQQRFFWAV
jgi:hypothetical protein